MRMFKPAVCGRHRDHCSFGSRPGRPPAHAANWFWNNNDNKAATTNSSTTDSSDFAPDSVSGATQGACGDPNGFGEANLNGASVVGSVTTAHQVVGNMCIEAYVARVQSNSTSSGTSFVYGGNCVPNNKRPARGVLDLARLLRRRPVHCRHRLSQEHQALGSRLVLGAR